MKTGRIIWKNIKLLMRSRTSTLVLILGPLIIIILVGISFSTSTFNLNIGAFSEKYSSLSDSLIEKLKTDNFAVTKYTTEDLCIDSVKEGQSHACIVFPPDMNIEDEQTDLIRFHVDQSKVNLVYLVMSTLTSSFGEKSSEISKDLTGNIITTLSNTKTGLQEAQALVTQVKDKNSQVISDSQNSITSLNNLDLEGEDLDVNTELSTINTELDTLLEEALELVDDGLDIILDLRDYDVPANQSSAFTNDLDSMEDTLVEINSSLKKNQNTTAKKLNDLMSEVTDAFNDLSRKLEDANTVNTDVTSKLANVKKNAEDLKQRTEALENKINAIILDINSIQVTDTEKIVSPIKTEINPIVKSQSNLGFLFPSLIVMLIMFIGLLVPSTLIIMEKSSTAYFRTFTTPTRGSLFVFATYMTSMLLLIFQVVIILLVSQLYFKINFLKSFFLVMFVLGIIMTFFVLFGMLIGYLFNTEEMAMIASSSVGTLFLLTSGIIFPLESMPSYIIDKARFNPVVLGSELFKKSLLFNASLNSVKMPIIYLIVFSFLLLVVIFGLRKAGKLQLMIRKPSKMKIRRDYLITLFDFGERKAKTLPEFIVSVQNMHDEKFLQLTKEYAFRDWLVLVYKNNYLAKKAEESKTKQDLIKVLVEELKTVTEQKQKKP